MELPSKIENTAYYFKKLSGIGGKSALRHVMQMTYWNEEDLKSFAKVINDLTTLKKCQMCGMFAEDSLCDICHNPLRFESDTLCIVESISDCLAIENGHQFKGKYFILGGVLNPLLGIGPDELKINFLIKRIKEESVQNVVVAINPSVEGDATCSYIQELIAQDVKVERIGFGIPMGGSLEFVDSLTIQKAFENKRSLR